MDEKSKKQATDQSVWKNRIIGYGESAPDQLIPNEWQFKIHKHVDAEPFLAILRTIGIIQDIIINKRTSSEWPDGQRHVETLLDGHWRALLAISDGQPTLPVKYVDLTPQEEKHMLALLDYFTTLARPDKDILQGLLGEIQSDEPAIQKIMSDLAETYGVLDEGHAFDSEEEIDPVPMNENSMMTCPKCGHQFAWF